MNTVTPETQVETQAGAVDIRPLLASIAELAKALQEACEVGANGVNSENQEEPNR